MAILGAMKALFLIYLCILARVYGKAISCIGYIKSDIQVDLSKIQIKLLTDRGNLKFETECNPTDGFYTIPVYKPGNYQIKVFVPEGWIFEQDTRNIEIVDENSANSCDEDINFGLYGFTISGTVRSGNSPGPANFPLALYNANDNTLIDTTTTVEGGKYEFKAKLGSYVISTEDRSAQCIDRGKVRVDVQKGPVRVSPDIQISGYNLKVSVQDESGAPLSDVTVALSSNLKLQFDNIPVNAQRPEVRSDGMYSLKSDSNGVVHFYCLPPEHYSLKAEWKRGNVELNFGHETPVKIKFTAAETTLRAKSFNIAGQFSDTPISDVAIFVDGKQRATTDTSGKYVLKEMTSGSYQFSAKKENYVFSEMSVKLSPKENINLPHFKIERIAVCGIVDFDVNKRTSSNTAVKLAIHSFEDKSQVKSIINIDSNNNKFCTLLAPGAYIFEPSKSASYSFSPTNIQINLKATPILNVRFTQFKALIEGEVKCFDTCKNVVIQLWQGEEIIEEQSTTTNFKFIDVIPAVYTVRIRDDYNFWWEQSKYVVEVTDKDIKGLSFKQSGYKVEIQSSHSCLMKYASLSSKNSQQLKVNLNEGVNSVFFPRSDKYSFSIDSCHKFLISPERSTTTLEHLIVPSAERLILSAKNSQLSASIVTGKPSIDTKFKLLVKNLNNEKDDGILIEEIAISQSNNHSFVFYIDQSSVNEKFSITPQSEKYIFLPNSVTFVFDGECHSNIATFKSEIGKFISGTITPPVDGVEVSIIRKDDPSIILNSVVDSKGKYRVGPIWNVEDWQVQLLKEGYEFKPLESDSFSFQSIKLSHLRIEFNDIETSKPLAEVLVSISGPNNYRSSSVVDTSGVLTIIGLASGGYFVRPILQEYKFNATSISFKIKEGETQKLTLYAKKFAYSAFGKVTTINKQPISSIVRMEAVSEQCNNHQEEDATIVDTSEFRIRGLRPDCTYRLTPKDENGQRLSSYPPFVDILTGTEDKYDINFIVTPAETHMTLFGKIDFVLDQQSSNQKQHNNQQQPNNYHITLVQSQTQAVVQEIIVQSPASVFLFHNLSINHLNYSVGFESAEARKYGIEPVMVEFTADSTFKYVKLIAKPERRTIEVEVSKSNCLGLALIVIITLCFLNQAKAKVFTEKLMDYVQILMNNGYNGMGSVNDVDNSNKKRKSKK